MKVELRSKVIDAKSQAMPMVAHVLMGVLLLSLMSYGMGHQACKTNQAPSNSSLRG